MKPSQVKAVVRRSIPGAARVHRAYVDWSYSHRPAARRRLFELFFRENLWDDPDTASGPGSNLEQTEVLRAELPRLWSELGISRLADVPCGDFYWMSLIVDELDYYFGGDIVGELVASARERAHEQCDFAVFDLLSDEFPPVDAILVRDVLGCFSNRDVMTALRNVSRSSARYLLTTTFPGEPSQDIITGGWRPLNLAAPPFSLPEPLHLIDERSTIAGFEGKRLGVWEIDRLREHLGGRR